MASTSSPVLLPFVAKRGVHSSHLVKSSPVAIHGCNSKTTSSNTSGDSSSSQTPTYLSSPTQERDRERERERQGRKGSEGAASRASCGDLTSGIKSLSIYSDSDESHCFLSSDSPPDSATDAETSAGAIQGTEGNAGTGTECSAKDSTDANLSSLSELEALEQSAANSSTSTVHVKALTPTQVSSALPMPLPLTQLVPPSPAQSVDSGASGANSPSPSTGSGNFPNLFGPGRPSHRHNRHSHHNHSAGEECHHKSKGGQMRCQAHQIRQRILSLQGSFNNLFSKMVCTLLRSLSIPNFELFAFHQ